MTLPATFARVRQIVGKAAVDTPATLYVNVTVELVSDDDVTMEATVRDRQGLLLEVVRGPWVYHFDSEAYVVTVPEGVAVITKVGGCGCGGTSVERKLPAGADPGNGYLP